MTINSEKDLNIIRGKIMCGHGTQEEIHAFLKYVSKIEALVEEANCEDFFGSSGWQHRVGLD